MKKIFIDGKAGTTGLRIYERLADRKDIEIIAKYAFTPCKQESWPLFALQLFIRNPWYCI